jgi:hypothetical protein
VNTRLKFVCCFEWEQIYITQQKIGGLKFILMKVVFSRRISRPHPTGFPPIGKAEIAKSAKPFPHKPQFLAAAPQRRIGRHKKRNGDIMPFP